jgi:hypothetical protein
MTGQRSHDECAGLARTALERDVQRVIPVRKVAGQRQVSPRLPAAVDFAPFEFLQVRSACASAHFAAASDGDAPVEFPFERIGRNCQRHDVTVRMHDRHRRQQRTQSRSLAFVQFAFDCRRIRR